MFSSLKDIKHGDKVVLVSYGSEVVKTVVRATPTQIVLGYKTPEGKLHETRFMRRSGSLVGGGSYSRTFIRELRDDDEERWAMVKRKSAQAKLLKELAAVAVTDANVHILEESGLRALLDTLNAKDAGMSTADAPPVRLPRLFVYCGQRWYKGAHAVRIALLNEDGSLDEFKEYAYSRALARSIGAVYKGATFSEREAFGLSSAVWVKRFDDNGVIMVWESEEWAALDSKKLAALEKDSGRISELERLLAPLRKEYEKMVVRHDHAGCAALETALLKTLRSRPRSYE